MADYSLVQRGVVTITPADGAGPINVTLGTAVKLGSAKVHVTIAEQRFPDADSDLDYRGATVRLTTTTNLQIAWKGGALIDDPFLGAAEEITVSYEVFDIEDIGDDLKELLFRTQRILGYLGENVIQDQLIYDDAGNMVQYRLRAFNSKVNAEAATPELPLGDPLEAGEVARVLMTQNINFGKNDRTLLYRLLTNLIDTPGVG